MLKLLDICIPTYKRPVTLLRCVDSIVQQIGADSLSDSVGIYVANDASPDDTAEVVMKYESLSYLKVITRKQNLGMNQNIRRMLQEASGNSHYQLIITDDDYLHPNVLSELVKYLLMQKSSGNIVPTFWTPRFSYLENGDLFTIVCNPFNENRFVKPSAVNAGQYMFNGFVLSGLIVRAEFIDYEFWEVYKENAFFPIIFFGDLVFRFGARYLNKNIVHHTVLNECHWERWGKNDVVIMLRLFADFANAYVVMARRIDKITAKVAFYTASTHSIYGIVFRLMSSDKLGVDKRVVREAINDLKEKGVLRFEFQLLFLMLCSYVLVVAISMMKVVFYASLFILIWPILTVRSSLGYSVYAGGEFRKKYYLKQLKSWLGLLRNIPISLRVIL